MVSFIKYLMLVHIFEYDLQFVLAMSLSWSCMLLLLPICVYIYTDFTDSILQRYVMYYSSIVNKNQIFMIHAFISCLGYRNVSAKGCNAKGSSP